MNKPQPSSPRARLQQLQAIPERQRTEEEWDELNELEIMFAAGNRDTGHGHGGQDRNSHDRGNRELGPMRSGTPPQLGQGQGQGQGQRKPDGGPGGPGGGGRKGQRKFHKKPKKNLPPR